MATLDAAALARPDVVRAPARPSTRGAWQAAAGVGAALAGVGLLWSTCVGGRDLPTAVRTVVALVGVGLLFRAVHDVGRAVWGARFATGLVLAVTWLGVLVSAAVLADVLPLANHDDPTATITEPGYATPDLFSAHPLGTNGFALDLLARCIHGARTSLLTAGVAVTVSLVVGGLIGVVAGFTRGRFDVATTVVTDALLAFPGILLLITVAAVVGRPTTTGEAIVKNGLALALVGVPTLVRLARAHTIRFAAREFVYASRVMGARPARIVRRDVVPNVAPPLVSFAFVLLAILIVVEGSLSYIGLGLSQPEPTWGNMIAEGGLGELTDHPYIALVPGAFLFLTVLSLNQVGDALQARWDVPASRRRRSRRPGAVRPVATAPSTGSPT